MAASLLCICRSFSTARSLLGSVLYGCRATLGSRKGPQFGELPICRKVSFWPVTLPLARLSGVEDRGGNCRPPSNETAAVLR